ncbi:MAG: hypothetical protein ACOCTR_04610 [Candidatus Natronoplasma sp.]
MFDIMCCEVFRRLDAMKNKKKKNIKWRALQSFGILAVLCLVIGVLVPGAQAYDGINEDGKYYWNAHTIVYTQVHEDSAKWSIRNSDGVVDDGEHWGEIRFNQNPLYAEPYGLERDIVGHVRPYVQASLPVEPAGQTGKRVWPILVTFVVYQPNGSYGYDLGGFSAQYTTKLGHEIRQMDGNAWEFEIGGTNAQAPNDDSKAEAYFENIYEYAVGKTIDHDEVQLAIDMIRTWAEDDEPPEWYAEHDHQAERLKVEYTEDEDTYDGRYMTFWEKIDLLIPEEGDSGNPEESLLNIKVYGWAEDYNCHIDYDNTEAEWTLDIDVTDELEDGSSGGGGGGGGGTDPIPTGERYESEEKEGE